MKGSANAAWITWGARLRSVERRHGDRAQNRRGGAPGGARVGTTARGTSKGASCYPAPFRRSASLRGGKEDPGESPETGQAGLTSAGHRCAEPETLVW